MTQFENIETMDREQLLAGLRTLHSAICEHHRQKADDRCIEDDDRLYAAAGLPPCDRRVGNKAEMLRNCERFITNRCEGGGWSTYAELENRIKDLEGQHKGLVLRSRVLRDRLDLPVERAQFYREVVKLQIFKGLTHQLLNDMGVPEFNKLDCRVRARLAWLGGVLRASRGVVKPLQELVNQNDPRRLSNEQVDRVYAWFELEPLAAALAVTDGATDGQSVPHL